MEHTATEWHCECLLCHHRYYEAVTIMHNAGYDWADSSSFCPSCGQPNESSREYAMHDGPIPGTPGRRR